MLITICPSWARKQETVGGILFIKNIYRYLLVVTDNHLFFVCVCVLQSSGTSGSF